MNLHFQGISGNLQAIASTDDGKTTIYLEGDRGGLLSLARLALQLAEVDQTKLISLPSTGASEHIHLKPDIDLSQTSNELVLGRLDNKIGGFDDTFKERSFKTPRSITHLW